MHLLALLIIGLSGYVGFARTREGAAAARSVAEGVLGGAMLSLLLGIGTVWLFGATVAHVVEANLTLLSLSFVAALIGSFTAALRPRRAPLPRW